jgi:hypothetical protein
MKGFNYISMIDNELKRCTSLAERKYRKPKPGTCEAVLTDLLEQIKPIDFRAKSGLPDEGKISRKVYVVVTVDEVLGLLPPITGDWLPVTGLFISLMVSTGNR